MPTPRGGDKICENTITVRLGFFVGFDIDAADLGAIQLPPALAWFLGAHKKCHNMCPNALVYAARGQSLPEYEDSPMHAYILQWSSRTSLCARLPVICPAAAIRHSHREKRCQQGNCIHRNYKPLWLLCLDGASHQQILSSWPLDLCPDLMTRYDRRGELPVLGLLANELLWT